MKKSEIEKLPEFGISRKLVEKLNSLPEGKKHHIVKLGRFTIRRCARRQINAIVNGRKHPVYYQLGRGIMVGIDGEEKILDHRWNVHRIACMLHRRCDMVA